MEKRDMKKTTPEVPESFSEIIIDLKAKGHKVKEIAAILEVHEDYVRHVLEKYRKNGNSLPKEKKRGRKVGEKES